MDVGIEHAHRPTLHRQRRSQVCRQSGLAHAALAAHYRHNALDVCQARGHTLALGEDLAEDVRFVVYGAMISHG